MREPLADETPSIKHYIMWHHIVYLEEMADSILDNIRELIIMEVGDVEILKRIRRAAEMNEAISFSEREYVGNLVKQHLAPPEPEPEPGPPQPRTRRIAATPAREPARKAATTRRTATTRKVAATRKGSSRRLTSRSTAATTRRRPASRRRAGAASARSETVLQQKTLGINRLYLIIIAGAVASAVISGVILSGSGPTGPQPVIPPNPINPPPAAGGSELQADQISYARGDIISISGESDADSVSLSVVNSDGTPVWSDSSNVRADGTYTNMLIAGGSGWEAGGEYAIRSVHDGDEFILAFDFEN